MTSKLGYLYVLSHPSDPHLIKVGHTSGTLKDALKKHNTDFTKPAGEIVKVTGKKWKVKQNIKVPDPAYSKAAFWETSAQHVFRGKIDVTRMSEDEL